MQLNEEYVVNLTAATTRRCTYRTMSNGRRQNVLAGYSPPDLSPRRSQQIYMATIENIIDSCAQLAAARNASATATAT